MEPARAAALALAAFAAAWFAFVAVSATATHSPFVLADEAAYLLPTLFGPGSANYERWEIVPQLPNFLYFAIYGLLPEEEAYRSAKLLNAAFVAAAALPAYATARTYLRPWQAAAFGAMVVATPVATFARYYMPESLFHFGFWCVAWILLRPPGRGAAVVPVAAGAALGLLALVKPHALALVAAACVYLLLRRPVARWRGFDAAVLVACFLIARTLAARLFGGAWELSLSGPSYGAALLSSRLAPGPMLVNALGHVAALTLLAGMPLAAVAGAWVRDLRRTEPGGDAYRDVALLALASLAAALAMAVAFAALVHAANPGLERETRLHGRYYVHVLPLVMLAFAAVLRSRRPPSFPARRATVAAFAVVAAGAVWVLVRYYEVGIVDYPDLALLPLQPWGVVAFATAGTAGLGLVLLGRGGDGVVPRSSQAWPLAWWAALALSTTVLALAAPLAGMRFLPRDVDRAMLGDEVLRGLRQRADGMVIGSSADPVDAYRVMFHLASLSRGRLVDATVPVEHGSLPADVKWLILLPGVAFAGAEPVRNAGPLRYVELRAAPE